jgi:hypothetical protein
MGRTTDARMKPEVGETREAKIAAMLAAGLGAEAIQSALEYEATECIPKDDPRRKSIKNCKPFDPTARQRMLEAIRSTRRLMRIEDEDMQALVNSANGDAPMAPVTETPLSNMTRRSTGETAIDQMYGSSRFIWLKDDNEKKPEKGRYRRGDYMPSWMPVFIAHQGFVGPLDVVTPPTKDASFVGTFEDCYLEMGIPDAFLSIWAGSPGVGKSRLAIAMTKKMNLVERHRSKMYNVAPRPVLYYNGEAEKSQFRQWCGTDVDPELFLVHHGEMIRTEKIVQDCLTHRPWAVFVDSFQMLAEVEKGVQGTLRALSRFKLLKNDKAAGMPHIFFISQLNKKGEMSGSRKIPHMVDFVATVTKYERGKGCFIIECPEKNRGGQTGLGGMYRHTDTGIECLSTNHRTGPIFKLLQQSGPATPTSQPANRAAVVLPSAGTNEPAPAAGDSLPPRPVMEGMIV